MRFLLARSRLDLEILWPGAQISAVMKSNFPHRQRTAGSGAFEPDAFGLDRARLDRPPVPVPSEVLGEIGLLIAAHLALAVAIVFTLQSLGMD